MLIVRTKSELRDRLKELRFQRGCTSAKTGFVPTMGYLHEGHMSLIEKSKSENDITVVSIFVNPAQFNDPQDYAAYPENLKNDEAICEKLGTDILFIPDKKEFFPDTKPSDPLEGNKLRTGKALQSGLIRLSIPDLTANLCGPGRPGHFEGVILIIIKLFNTIQPDNAYFGKKDYQQYRIIQKMTQDLDYPVRIVGVPTLREKSGLAMSSRNARLSEKGKEQASLIFRALNLAKKAYDEGKRESEILCEIARDVIETGSLNRTEYVQIVRADNLQPVSNLNELNKGEKWLIACAVFCEGVRLIDNMEFTVQ